jgi:hypothetical protein
MATSGTRSFWWRYALRLPPRPTLEKYQPADAVLLNKGRNRVFVNAGLNMPPP